MEHGGKARRRRVPGAQASGRAGARRAGCWCPAADPWRHPAARPGHRGVSPQIPSGHQRTGHDHRISTASQALARSTAPVVTRQRHGASGPPRP